MSQDNPSSLRLRVITSRSLLADADVDEVSVPSLEGYLGILPDIVRSSPRWAQVWARIDRAEEGNRFRSGADTPMSDPSWWWCSPS
jgi:hypothetical protein